MIRRLGEKIPRIAESAFVSEAAYVVGDVEIGEDSSVWPGAVIRGDFGSIKIGRNTIIEDNCMIHSGTYSAAIGNVSIGDQVVIGHGAVLNCRRIGDQVLVGMNATILHDVEIGNNCIIGAGCLVSQGMNIPDNSFVVGVPAKVKRPVTPEQLRRVDEGYKLYLELAKEYKKQKL